MAIEKAVSKNEQNPRACSARIITPVLSLGHNRVEHNGMQHPINVQNVQLLDLAVHSFCFDFARDRRSSARRVHNWGVLANQARRDKTTDTSEMVHLVLLNATCCIYPLLGY
jgi:hypothetical protein